MIVELIAGLIRANLAAAVAVYAVVLIRRPARRAFGARAAYLLWAAPALAAAATLIPPASAPAPLMAPVAAYATAVAIGVQAGVAAAPGLPWVLFGLWMAGGAAAAAVLLWRQARYMGAIARLEAGPAVVGAIRPRIVTPANFETRFDAAEREMILAHERAHLSGHDARINALAAAALCACWFNPLVHLGVYLMRLDQELACDAAVLERFPSARRLYAQVLLKTQLVAQPLPFGCHWPAAGEHPLKERIVMLKSPLPAPARRLAGVAMAVLLSGLGAAAAWAAQPGQALAPAPLAAVIRLAAAAPDERPPAAAPATTKARVAAPPPSIPPPTEPRAVPAAAADLPPRQALVMPDWMLKPRGEDVARFYPPAAVAAGQRGLATLGCRVAADGRLQRCQVVFETPQGAGFGEAALRMAELFQMKPLDRNGAPTANQDVRIPIKFDLPPAEGAALAPFPDDIRELVRRLPPERWATR